MTRRARRLRIALALVAAGAGPGLRGAPASPPDAPAPAPSAGRGEATSGVRFENGVYTNRLIASRDPYLLLHAHNPVDWYPWGPEALEKARREDKPIFLSVGYSTCYWCHVAEREIYSNPEIAERMNEWFVNVKVDREERPDVDRLYLLATQLMTGSGGWPNNVFLTPDLEPFFAGSYFPPEDREGRPGFPTILASLHGAWTHDRAKVVEVAARVYQEMEHARRAATSADGPPLDPGGWIEQAVHRAAGTFDAEHGGFSGGGATRFPEEPLLDLLLAAAERRHDERALGMVATTLRAMAEGGVMDQLAGGFHRYSTEPTWSIPHFEKMLSDNAELLGLYARAFRRTGDPLFKQVAERTARYLTTEMRAPDGGFYSARDAQVGGIEGASYVWSREAIEALLGTEDARRFFALYALTPMPEGPAGPKRSPGGVLRLDPSLKPDGAGAPASSRELTRRIDALAPLREKLLAARDERPQPARDEKIVTADNALAILGFLEAGRALGDPSLTKVAVETADWEWRHAVDPRSGEVRHQLFAGQAGGPGFLDDYALLGDACLELSAATKDAVWRERAERLAGALLARFARPDGSLGMTPDPAGLPLEPPPTGDSVRPSGQAAAARLLLGLAADGGEARFARAARRSLAPLAAQIAAAPEGWGSLLAALARPELAKALETAATSGGAGQDTPPGLPSSADRVQATARLVPAGEGRELTVELVVAEGSHVNANPASGEDLVPTTLTVDGLPDLAVVYPEPETFEPPFAPEGLAVYTGKVTLRARLPAGSPAPRRARVRVQACDDAHCLAPATLDVPVTEGAAGDGNGGTGTVWRPTPLSSPPRVEIRLRRRPSDTIRYYRREAVGPRVDDVSGLQDREAFRP